MPKTRSLWKNNKNTYKSFQTCKIKGKTQIAIIRNGIEDIITDFSENKIIRHLWSILWQWIWQPWCIRSWRKNSRFTYPLAGGREIKQLYIIQTIIFKIKSFLQRKL